MTVRIDPLPSRRPHFVRLVEWAGVTWLIGVGLDPAGVAVEIFADVADQAAKVDRAFCHFVHSSFITTSKYLTLGVRAADHAARLASNTPDLLELALCEAVRVEAEEGAKVRALEAWRARRLAGERIGITEFIEAAVGQFAALPPDEQEAQLRAQRDSWVRGELAIGLDAEEAAERAAAERSMPIPQELNMDTVTETTAPEIELTPPWGAIADGEYAIVELFGHTTLIGRITEVECFGAKMLAMELLYGGKLLDPIYHGGAAIYRLSPCSRQVAWQRQHSKAWQLPSSIRAVLPPELLPSPQGTLPADDEYDATGNDDDDDYH